MSKKIQMSFQDHRGVIFYKTFDDKVELEKYITENGISLSVKNVNGHYFIPKNKPMPIVNPGKVSVSSKSKKNSKSNKKTNTPALPKHVDKIIDTVNKNNMGIILKDHMVMQDIRTKSGPIADSCEYQVHYWAAIYRITNNVDNSILDICIPTCYFNYKQQSTSGHIDFELVDVEAVSVQVKPIHNMKINDLDRLGFKDRLAELFEGQDVSIEMTESDYNTIHKHPGGSRRNSYDGQGFSGTDLCKNHLQETGVVFPLSSGDKKPNFAGIMAHDGGSGYWDKSTPINNVSNYEYRLVSGAITDDPNSRVTYSKGMCVAYIREPEVKQTFFKSLFVPTPESGYYKTKDIDPADSADFFNALAEIWDNLDFTQSTDLVIPSNVTEKHSRTGFNYKHNGNKHNKHNNNAKNTKSSTKDVSVQGTLIDDENSYMASLYGDADFETHNIPGDDEEEPEFLKPDQEEFEYFNTIKDIKFLTSNQILVLSDDDIRKEAMNLSSIYFREEDEDTNLIISEMTRAKAINEYDKLQSRLETEIEEYAPIYMNLAPDYFDDPAKPENPYKDLPTEGVSGQPLATSTGNESREGISDITTEEEKELSIVVADLKKAGVPGETIVFSDIQTLRELHKEKC